MKAATAISWGVRLLLLAGAVCLALPGPAPVWLARIFPSLSPLAEFGSALAGRGWVAGAAWVIVPLAILVLAAVKGRFFCRHICPAGTLYALAAKMGVRRTVFPWRVNGILFWSILFGSLAGLPFLLPLDPLVTFNSSLTPALFPRDPLEWVAGGLLPLFLVLGAIQPMIWCSRFCPLGYAMDLVGRFRRNAEPSAPDPIRRDLLIGAGIGLPLAILANRSLGSGLTPKTLPVLPPGAQSMYRFSGTCTRCYACVQKCPTRVIRLIPPKLESIGTMFLPYLDTDKSTCAEFCNDCTQACPSGALTPMSVEEKKSLQIGIAEINRPACLAWTDGEHCVVCQEFCPYKAIEDNPRGLDNLPRPVVIPELCRGCGACENQCPAKRAGKAIRVRGVLAQQTLSNGHNG